jgi:hypothetical protein
LLIYFLLFSRKLTVVFGRAAAPGTVFHFPQGLQIPKSRAARVILPYFLK